MKNYKKIKLLCDKITSISKSFVDELLIYYAAEKEGFEKKFADKVKRYKSIIARMPESWLAWLLPQYIAHKIFKNDGLANKYKNHPAIIGRTHEELEYFNFQINHPWRFSLCSVNRHPTESFFEMNDEILGTSFLLYSPGVEDIIEEDNYFKFFFLLIGFNGECWQTYGPLVYFKGFMAYDFFYFAKQINPNIDFVSDVQNVIESNPIPFMMLFVGAELPLTYHKKNLIVFCSSEYHVEDFNLEDYSDRFIVEKRHPVYMLLLKRWHRHPHFAKCYYHSKLKRFIISSMTAQGYNRLIESLNRTGYDFPVQPDIMVSPAMLTASEDILSVKHDIDPYGKAFAKEPSPSNKKELEKINNFLHSFTNALNNNENYDIEELAKTSGIEAEAAEKIAEKVIKSINRNLGRK